MVLTLVSSHRHLSLELMDHRLQQGDDAGDLLREASEARICQWCARDLQSFFEALERGADVQREDIRLALSRALAPRRLGELLSYPVSRRREAVEEDVNYQDFGLCELLCQHSEQACDEGRLREGQHLAALAGVVAGYARTLPTPREEGDEHQQKERPG